MCEAHARDQGPEETRNAGQGVTGTMTPDNLPLPAELLAIRAGMARQNADALASLVPARPMAQRVAASLMGTGQVLLLGSRSSHLCGRMAAPAYRKLGLAAQALPFAEQIEAPQPPGGRTLLVTSRSGECLDACHWLEETGGTPDSFGLTLVPDSFLARSLPSLIGAGGPETGIGTARSMMVTLALHLAILSALGADTEAAEEALVSPVQPDLEPAIAALSGVRGMVALGHGQHGLAEAMALGLCKLVRIPCMAMPCGQFIDGPERVLSSGTGIIGFRDRTVLLARPDAAEMVRRSGAPFVMFDASGAPPVEGAVTIPFPPLDGLAATLAMLPVAQRLVVELAARAPAA